MIRRASNSEYAAWVLMGAALLFALVFHLVSGLLAGLLIYSLVHHVDRWVRKRRLASRKHARLIALLILGAIGLLLAVGLGLMAAAAWRARATALPELLSRMAHALESTRSWLGDRWIPIELVDAEGLRGAMSTYLTSHASWLKAAGGAAGRVLAHVAVGLAIGLLAAFHHPESDAPRPLAAALAERLRRLLASFEAVVYAQVRISALNTALTALFLFVILPLFGVKLPLRLTLVSVTFFAGLLPVLGNLASNTAIVVISLGAGPGVALGSLAYLVVIHKLEYFLNARLVGESIQAKAWEVLASMVVLEVLFGTPGLILAPVVYAYLKGELRDRGLV